MDQAMASAHIPPSNMRLNRVPLEGGCYTNEEGAHLSIFAIAFDEDSNDIFVNYRRNGESQIKCLELKKFNDGRFTRVPAV